MVDRLRRNRGVNDVINSKCYAFDTSYHLHDRRRRVRAYTLCCSIDHRDGKVRGERCLTLEPEALEPSKGDVRETTRKVARLQ